MKKNILPILCLFQFFFVPVQGTPQNELRLWYNQPATDWNEALPIGNGRLGAMVFGNPQQERIQLNEESLWAGAPGNNNNPAARSSLPTIQRLILNDSLPEAVALADKTLLGSPSRVRSYQPLCDLLLDFGPRSTSDYIRELDLTTGVCRTTYTSGNTSYSQEIFASAPDNVIVMRLKAKGKEPLSVTVHLSRSKDATAWTEGNRIFLSGQIVDADDKEKGPGGKHMRFFTQLRSFHNGGTTEPSDDGLRITAAREILLVLTAVTDYKPEALSYDPQQDLMQKCNSILNKTNTDYARLYRKHIKEYSELFNRVTLKLNPSETPDSRPTDERLEAVKKGADDPQLVALYFQYGRYLLMNSSRAPGILPANLQGIWNESYTAPWNSDFHTNINLQMNYWPAEVCNLSETVKPLIGFLSRIERPGSETAREMYGAHGWTLHHLTDVFGRTGVMDGVQWGMFPMAGPWMTFPLYEHYLFTGDRDYLEEKGYPLMKNSARFVLDYLIKDKEGYWVTAPSNSPENSYIHPSGKRFRLTYAATMDIQIITELFQNCIEASTVLNKDAAFADTLKSVLQNLPPIRISEKTGGIQEWIKDYDEEEPGHRHMSHLLGLYPGNQITAETPELFDAARKSLINRLSKGGGHTGWSRAWIINFYARLGDSKEAHKHVMALLARSTQRNLFNTHPPFQIDGNFGGTAGIAEMLIQSDIQTITLLPALPEEWAAGRVSGLKTRGNAEVSVWWENGQLQEANLTAGASRNCRIRSRTPFRWGQNKSKQRNGFYELIIPMGKGKTYRLSNTGL